MHSDGFGPSDNNPENHRTLVILVGGLIVAFGVFLFWIRSRKPLLFLSLGWYALALFPMANVIPLRNGPICDYYLFLPSLGLAVFISWLVQSALTFKAKNWAIGIASVWLVFFLVTTNSWAKNWKSIKTLAEQTLQSQPENFLILGTLAKAEMDLGNMEASEAYIERGLKLAPWYSPLYYHKINLLIKKEEFEAAISILEDLIPKQENMAKPYVVLAYIYDINLGRWQEAEKLLATALEKPWDPRFSKTGAMNLAYIYYKTERRQFALQVYESLLERYPSDPEIAEKYTDMKHIDQLDTVIGAPSEDQ
jgi:tetratricopeptide (TPR) repeat protein